MPDITDKLEKMLPLPVKGAKIAFDTRVKGFGIRVTAAGARSFVLNYHTKSGRERRDTVGSFPDWKTAAARALKPPILNAEPAPIRSASPMSSGRRRLSRRSRSASRPSTCRARVRRRSGNTGAARQHHPAGAGQAQSCRYWLR
jgi:hypothetical protein